MRLSPATVALALAPAAAVVALDGFGVGMPHQIRLWQALLEHEDDSSVAAVLLEPTSVSSPPLSLASKLSRHLS